MDQVKSNIAYQYMQLLEAYLKDRNKKLLDEHRPFDTNVINDVYKWHQEKSGLSEKKVDALKSQVLKLGTDTNNKIKKHAAKLSFPITSNEMIEKQVKLYREIAEDVEAGIKKNILKGENREPTPEEKKFIEESVKNFMFNRMAPLYMNKSDPFFLEIYTFSNELIVKNFQKANPIDAVRQGIEDKIRQGLTVTTLTGETTVDFNKSLNTYYVMLGEENFKALLKQIIPTLDDKFKNPEAADQEINRFINALPPEVKARAEQVKQYDTSKMLSYLLAENKTPEKVNELVAEHKQQGEAAQESVQDSARKRSGAVSVGSTNEPKPTTRPRSDAIVHGAPPELPKFRR